MLPLHWSDPALYTSEGVLFHDKLPLAEIVGRFDKNVLFLRCHAASLFAVARSKSGRRSRAISINSSILLFSSALPNSADISAIFISWSAGKANLANNVPLAISRLFLARSNSNSLLANVTSAFNTSALATTPALYFVSAISLAVCDTCCTACAVNTSALAFNNA